MTILNPSAFYLLPLLGLIFFFYLLKARLREVKVSSTLFWQKISQILPAQHLRWRLPSELLLFLELVFLGLLIMALAQILLPIKGEGEEYLVVVMDATASMQATDLVPDRLSVAKERARELIKELSGKKRVALIQADDRPKLLVNFSDDRASLLKKLEDLKASDVKGDADAALRLAISLFPPEVKKNIIFFTDGAFELSPDSVPAGVKLALSSTDAPCNLGITSLRIRPGTIGGRDYQVLVAVGNFSPQEETFSLKLWLGEKLINEEKLTLPPQKEGQYVYSVKVTSKAILKAELDSYSRDDLTVDNIAYAVFGGPRNLDILLVSHGNLFLETALGAYSGINLYVKNNASAQEILNYDLVIFDGIIPPPLNQGNVVCIGTLPIDLLPKNSGLRVNSVLTEWETDHPLLRFVNLNDTNVLWSIPVPTLPNGEAIVRSTKYPLMQVWQKHNLRLVFIAFDLYYSDFPLQVGFPIFIFNLLQWFHPQVFDPDYYQIQTGEDFPIPSGYERSEVTILNPHRQINKSKIESRPVFWQTKIAGVYRFKGETLFAANLVESQESNLISRVNLPGPVGSIQQQVQSRVITSKFSLYPLLIVISCLFLLIEWYLYHFPLRRNR